MSRTSACARASSAWWSIPRCAAWQAACRRRSKSSRPMRCPCVSNSPPPKAGRAIASRFLSLASRAPRSIAGARARPCSCAAQRCGSRRPARRFACPSVPAFSCTARLPRSMPTAGARCCLRVTLRCPPRSSSRSAGSTSTASACTTSRCASPPMPAPPGQRYLMPTRRRGSSPIAPRARDSSWRGSCTSACRAASATRRRPPPPSRASFRRSTSPPSASACAASSSGASSSRRSATARTGASTS